MKLATVNPHRGRVHTPLRYPGGKTRLVSFLRLLIDRGQWNNCTYAEPYAGGAGAAISLLMDGTVPRIAINDLDPAIAAFWRTTVDSSDWFAEQILKIPLDLDEWTKQKAIYRARDLADPASLGLATFYLNRTNRSGVLNAGVIGGKAQAGTYRIGARFNREDLAAKVRAIGALRDRIEVSSEDGVVFIARHLETANSFIYADPPYYEKGSFLYMNSFDDGMHTALATTLNSRPTAPWVLTYDDVPEVRRLYPGRFQGTFELPYSAHKSTMFAERMIVSSSVARYMEEFTPQPPASIQP